VVARLTVLAFSEHHAPHWAQRLWALCERPTVCRSLGEALRALVIRFHHVVLVELRITGQTHAGIVEMLCDHPTSQGVRFVFITDTPQLIPLRRDRPELRVLAPTAADLELRAAIAVQGHAPTSKRRDEQVVAGPAPARWDLATCKSRWRAANHNDVSAKAVVLLALCAGLQARPDEATEVTLRWLAPRVRTVVNRIPKRLQPVRTTGPAPAASLLVIERLIEAWIAVLDQRLLALDQRATASGPEQLAARLWYVAESVYIQRVRVELEVIWGMPPRAGAWIRLHDTYIYTDQRLRSQVRDPRGLLQSQLAAIEQTYREALLLGCALGHPPAHILASPGRGLCVHDYLVVHSYLVDVDDRGYQGTPRGRS
jgi:hypothetical protein